MDSGDRTLWAEYEGDHWKAIDYEGSMVPTSRLSSLIENIVPGGPIVASYLALGWPPVLLSGTYFLTRGTEASTSFLVALAIATVLLASLPGMIYYYDERVLATFTQRMTGRVHDVSTLAALAERYEALFARRFWITAAPWTALIVAVYVFSTPTLEAHGVAGWSDPAYWVLFAFFVWGGVLTGIGFHGIVVTIGYIRAITDELRLRIDPYHPDKLGGLSSVGYFAIRTTLLVSAGALLLPLAFELAAGTPIQGPIYLAVVVYVAFIAFSFAYPTWLVNRAAHAVRVNRLSALGDRIASLQTELDRTTESSVDVEVVAKQLELGRLQQLHDDYRTIRLYPMSPQIISQLLGSIFLPVVALVVEVFVLF